MPGATKAPQNASERIICPVCGITLTPNRPWQVYCSAKCRRAMWTANNPTVPVNQPERLIDQAKRAK